MVVAGLDEKHPRLQRFPLIDGLRAVAMLCVFFTHIGAVTLTNSNSWFGIFTAQLTIGVTIFFLITGFLIYRPFVLHRVAGQPMPTTMRYYRKRLLRIVPAYWLALTVLWIYPSIPMGHGLQPFVIYGFGQIYFLHTFFLGIVPAWSVCVEMSFYLLLPFFVIVIAATVDRLAPRLRLPAEFSLLAFLSVISIAIRVVFRADFPQSVIPSTGVGYMFWFALGMGVALLSCDVPLARGISGLAERLPRIGTYSWLLAIALFIAMCVGLDLPRGAIFTQNPSDFQIIGQYVSYGVIALLVFLPVVFWVDSPSLPRWLLTKRSVVWIGLISYGMFLWHLPIADKLATYSQSNWLPDFPGSYFISMAVLTGALALLCSTASYYLLERPLLRFK